MSDVEAIELNPYRKGCPTRRILDLVGDRWTVLVVGSLAEQPLRFSEIARRVEGVSQKMLTQTLRALERDGLAIRTAYPEVPPRVEYRLTPSGQSLLAPLKALESWSIEHFVDVHQAQALYDHSHAQ